jgi:hypothetical protein
MRVVLKVPVIPASEQPAHVRLTVPTNPVRGVTVTVKLADCPGVTVIALGLTEIEKSGVAGSTVIVRHGGLGSELPVVSIVVMVGPKIPGVLKVIGPGACEVEVAGDPPGKTQE